MKTCVGTSGKSRRIAAKAATAPKLSIAAAVFAPFSPHSAFPKTELPLVQNIFAIAVLLLPPEKGLPILVNYHMGAVLKPLFTFCIKPEHVRSKMSAFLWSRKIRKSTAKGPAKG